jgi:hypothetical protein
LVVDFHLNPCYTLTMNLEITRITVLRSAYGADKLFIHTDLPPTTWPYSDPATLTLEVSVGNGADYCKANFPNIPVEVVWG